MARVMILGSAGVGTVIARTLAATGHEVVLLTNAPEVKQQDPFTSHQAMRIEPVHTFDDLYIPTRKELDSFHVNPASRSYQARRRR